MLLAQLSDLHVLAPAQRLSGVVETDRLLKSCIAAVMALRPMPDAVLLSGDLVDSGKPEEYAWLRELLAPLPMPVYLIPGNHDDVRHLRSAFADHRYLPQEGALRWSVQLGEVRLIGLDSSITGHSHGRVTDDTLSWLDAALAEQPERPTLVALHHPPFNTGIRHMDDIGLENPADLAQVVRRHPQVERVLSGHVHRAITTRFAGTVASTCPSSAHQIELNLQPEHGGGYTLEPPGFLLHRWDAVSGLVSHLVPVGAFPGPFRFD